VTRPPAQRRRHRWWPSPVAAALAVAVLVAPSARADVAPAAPAHAAPASIEDDPVHYQRSADATAAGRGALPSTTVGSSATDVWRVTLSLCIVLGLVFGLRWLARKLAIVPPAGASAGGVTVLSRTVLSPKQQVLLLQVGRRIVVVGDAGAAGMRSLCEIDDPDEVAALVGQARAARSTASPARSFASRFRRATEPFDGPAVDAGGAAEPAREPSPDAAPEADMPGEVAGLLDRVRGLRQQFER
jgi:flagellar protein FliO/FliZ